MEKVASDARHVSPGSCLPLILALQFLAALFAPQYSQLDFKTYIGAAFKLCSVGGLVHMTSSTMMGSSNPKKLTQLPL